MIRFLLRPFSLFFIAGYIGFIFWLLSGTKVKDLSDFPWGNTYLENTNGKLHKLGQASYHFDSVEDSYINYEFYDHFKEGFNFQFPDGTSPEKIKLRDFKYNKLFRTLSAVCDFQSTNNGYLEVFFDHYIYENDHGFSKESGFELDIESYSGSLPFHFPNGAILTIEACSNNHLDAVTTDIFIRFEKNQYPDNEPSYETEIISVTSDINTYEIAIPKSLTPSGYGSVLMYLEDINTSLIIKDMTLKFMKDGKEFDEKLIFSKSFGSALIIEPFSDKDLKWEFVFRFSKDFSKIEGGYLEVHSEGHEPWRTNYGSDWFYLKSK